MGSAGWITDANGYAIQYMHYLPYGQLLANQMTGLYDERYKFTGKERDAETGYDYFGARFYSSQLLHWTSVDQLTDSYPWISPYAYAAWNPLRFVDPDGRKIVVMGRNFIERFAAKLGFSIGYIKKVKNDLAQLKLDNKDVGNMITALEESSNTHIIQFPNDTWNQCGAVGEKGSTGRGSVIDYDPENYKTVNGNTRTPRAGLAHELTHSSDFDTGNETSQEIDGVRVMEFKAINIENKVRNVTGDEKRTTYGGKNISEYIE